MPIKPVDTIFPWADAGNYPGGPNAWDGQPRLTTANLLSFAASGVTPQAPQHAGRWNEYLRRLQEFGTWVELGSNADDEDAHVVETDVLGQLNVARAQIGNHSVAGPSLSVTGSATLASLLASHTGSQNAILAQQSGTVAAIFGQATGTNNRGVQGEGAGTGDGVFGFGANNASAIGVRGEATHINGIGVRGQVNASATSSSSGVQGVGQAAGNGVLASVVGGGTGYPLFVFGDTTAPDRAAIHIDPQDADPVTQQQGDLYYHSGEGQFKGRRVGQVEGFWTTGDGFVHGGEFGQSAALSSSSSLLAKATAQISPPKAGDVVVEVGFMVGGDAANDGVEFDIFDATATAVIAGPFELEIPIGDGNDQPEYASVSVRANYTLPSAAGGRNIQLRMRRRSVGAFIFEAGFCEVRGLYD